MTPTIRTADGLELDCAHHSADGTRGAVLLAHGITQDMAEGGMFTRLAERLAVAGFDVVRFSYRGHGDDDDIVPYGPTRRVATASGADFYTIPDTGHAFLRPDGTPVERDSEREQDRRTVAWLRDRLEWSFPKQKLAPASPYGSVGRVILLPMYARGPRTVTTTNRPERQPSGATRRREGV